MLISVVLPAPFGPSRPKNSPGSMSKLTSSSARISPRPPAKTLLTFLNEMAGIEAAIVGTPCPTKVPDRRADGVFRRSAQTRAAGAVPMDTTRGDARFGRTMAPPAKAPRRTAERILEVTLDLFNRHGEPNVSTTAISAELGISPGNLYYHYPAKDELINTLFGRYEAALAELLHAADDVSNVEDAWLFFHMLFEL